MDKVDLFPDHSRCMKCGSTYWLEQHHIFPGALRNKSERYGAVVTLCHSCHNEPPKGVHHCQKEMEMWKAEAQRRIMNEKGWTKEQFIASFYKSYI